MQFVMSFHGGIWMLAAETPREEVENMNVRGHSPLPQSLDACPAILTH